MSNDKLARFRGMYSYVSKLDDNQLKREIDNEADIDHVKETVWNFRNDLVKDRAFNSLKGWSYTYNPFAYVDIERQDGYYIARQAPDGFPDSIDVSLNMAYGWLGVGCYAISEEYFHIAMSIIFLINWAEGVYPPASILGMLYLASGHNDSAYKISKQALQAIRQSVYAQDFVGYTSRLQTILVLSIYMGGYQNRVTEVIQKYDIKGLNKDIIEWVIDIYRFRNCEDLLFRFESACTAIGKLL